MKDKCNQHQIVDAASLVQDDHNFNKGTEQGNRLLRESLEKYGAGRSMLIDKDNRIIAGNKTQQKAAELGMKVKIVETDANTIIAVKRTDVSLDSKEGREMALLDNLTTQVNLAWDDAELENISECVEDFDVSNFGFEIGKMPNINFSFVNESEDETIERKRREFEQKMANGELGEDDQEYQEFLKKFEAKKTTDDCYTPTAVYDAIADFVANEYNISRANFVRPFYPGGDYKNEKYKPTDIVVDNPPFSILASIIDFYNEKGIRYFLFGPNLTLLTSTFRRCTAICCGVQIRYENGALVNTGFATNLEQKQIAAKTSVRLYKLINDAQEETKNTNELPKYKYPENVMTSPMFSAFSKIGLDFSVNHDECVNISH